MIYLFSNFFEWYEWDLHVFYKQASLQLAAIGTLVIKQGHGYARPRMYCKHNTNKHPSTVLLHAYMWPCFNTKVPTAANCKDACLQNTRKSHSYHSKNFENKSIMTGFI